mmetsp:Transcript_24844/g.66712  ORF Transcript_24844/g.66712 Transcript_24844/m.66712 type:complete len:139 (-) Transcript_24844:296-712(-)
MAAAVAVRQSAETEVQMVAWARSVAPLEALALQMLQVWARSLAPLEALTPQIMAWSRSAAPLVASAPQTVVGLARVVDARSEARMLPVRRIQGKVSVGTESQVVGNLVEHKAAVPDGAADREAAAVVPGTGDHRKDPV